MQAVVFPDAQLRQAAVQALKQHTRLAERLAGDVATVAAGSLDGHLHAFTHRQVLPRVDDVHDGAGPYALQVLQEGPGVASVGVGRVDALCRKIVQFLKIGVENDLFLVSVFEGFAARHDAVALAGCGDGCAATQAGDVPTQDVH